MRPALKCLESLSDFSCNDSLLGSLLPALCRILSSNPRSAPVLRLLGNLVTSECNDGPAVEHALVPRVLSGFFASQQELVDFHGEDGCGRCLALRILASLSSSPAFDTVFSSSGVFQVKLCCTSFIHCTC